MYLSCMYNVAIHLFMIYSFVKVYWMCVCGYMGMNIVSIRCECTCLPACLCVYICSHVFLFICMGLFLYVPILAFKMTSVQEDHGHQIESKEDLKNS